ncbi:MAG: TetR/AcrR family transcriptional regulator [Pseudomonadota bacterium]
MSDATALSAQDRKTDAILDAAKEHFAVHGFEATKLSAIAKDAGVAVGTIYLRHTGKAQLLSAVLERAERGFSQAMDREDIWDTSFPQRFHAIILAIFEAASREEHLPRLMALSSYAANAVTPDKSDKSMPEKSNVLGGIEAHLKDGMARKELRSDIDVALAARMAHGLVEGAMRAMMADPARDPADVITETANAATLWLVRAKAPEQPD